MSGWYAAVFRAARVTSSIAYASALWLAASLPIVTLPPATAALHATIVRRRTTGDQPAWRLFLADARRWAAPSYQLSAVLAAVCLVLAGDVLLAARLHRPALFGASLALAAAVGLLLAQSWPALLATGDARAAAIESARRGLHRPGRAVGCLCAWVMPWLILLTVPGSAMIVTVLTVPALTAWGSLACSDPSAASIPLQSRDHHVPIGQHNLGRTH